MSLSPLFALVPDVRLACCCDTVGMATVALTCRWAAACWRQPQGHAIPLLEGASKQGHLGIVRWLLWDTEVHYDATTLFRSAIHAMHGGSFELCADVLVAADCAEMPDVEASFAAYCLKAGRELFLSRVLDVVEWPAHTHVLCKIGSLARKNIDDADVLAHTDMLSISIPLHEFHAIEIMKNTHHHVLRKWELGIIFLRARVPGCSVECAVAMLTKYNGNGYLAFRGALRLAPGVVDL